MIRNDNEHGADSLPSGDDLGIDLLRGKAAKIINSSVQRILRGGNSTPDDRLDLAQELRWEILRRLRWYDPKRGSWPAFATIIVRSQESKLRRDHFRRHHPIGGGEFVIQPSESADRLDLCIDAACAIDQLPEELADLCKLVQEDAVATTARRLGVPRRTLRTKLIKLKRHFSHHKLSDYWPGRDAS